jgi:anti-sigma-K factor RskA
MSSDLHDLSGAFAVDALDDDERRGYERHLEACADCRREVAELQAATTLLVEDRAPPATLRDRVLAEARGTPQQPRLPDVVPSPSGRDRQSWARPGVQPPARRWALPALAAALVLAVFGLSAVLLRTTARVGELEAALADAEQARQVAALVESPDARLTELDTPEGVRARFMWSAQQGEGLLMVGDLPAPPPGSTYALWLIEGDRPRFAGAFQPGADGEAVAAVTGDVARADVIGVTIEPHGPIDAPTTQPFISGALS